MYKVLLVDDERVILEGISAIVDWESQGVVLAGTARNGVEAFEFIRAERPDIVITDIRMPGMDGLKLIETVKSFDPTIAFILLSGFDEFDYARTAMQFGVRHYLLKPCNETAICQALGEITGELDRREDRERFLQRMEQELQKVLPHAKEQFLKEFVTNKTYGKRDWEDFKRLFGITFDNKLVRLLLFQPEGNIEYEHLFALKNIAEDILDKHLLLVSATMGRHVLILIREKYEPEALYELIRQIQTTFADFYHREATIAASAAGEIANARSMYRETLECLGHRFYLGEGSLITRKDIVTLPGAVGESLQLDEDRLVLNIKAGRWEDVQAEIADTFQTLAKLRLETNVAKSYLIQLFISVIRQSDADQFREYFREIARLQELSTLSSLQEYIEAAAKAITMSHYELNRHNHSLIVRKVQDIIRENLGNQKLSLLWVANDMLYMNADYLGKLFKKETGEKFSSYVMKARIDKAVELMRQGDVKVFELAEMLGFGDNPQYFSKVFKKITGYAPSEFLQTP